MNSREIDRRTPRTAVTIQDIENAAAGLAVGVQDSIRQLPEEGQEAYKAAYASALSGMVTILGGDIRRVRSASSRDNGNVRGDPKQLVRQQ